MLELREVLFHWGKHLAVNRVSACFEPGKITALLGPNGCGKSTLLGLAAGLLRPEEGTVRLSGRNLQSIPRRERSREIALLRQNAPLSPLPAGEVVLAGRWPYRRTGFGWSAEDRQIARLAMERTGCLAFADRPENRLSGGERQRVLLAAALAQDVDILLLDEPTTYLDVGVSLETLQLVRSITREEHKTVVAVLHDLPLALRMADRILLMKEGQIAAQGTATQLLEDGCLERVFGVRIRCAQVDGDDFYRIG